jgi:hypothetical protein
MVFNEGTSQDNFYKSTLRPLIRSLLSKKANLCVLGFGPTSSGKSFTIKGTATDHGLLPRAVEDLLYQIKEKNTRSIEADHSLYESQHARERLNGLRNHALGLKVSIAQVFMEKTYDLLNDAEIANKRSVNEVEKVTKKSIGSIDGLAKVLS